MVSKSRDVGTAAGAVKELRAMDTGKRQKNLYHYACFCVATTLTSKIIAEIIENRSKFHWCANSCYKVVSSRSSSTIKLPKILLWKHTSAAVAPVLKWQGAIPRYFTALRRSWNHLWCC